VYRLKVPPVESILDYGLHRSLNRNLETIDYEILSLKIFDVFNPAVVVSRRKSDEYHSADTCQLMFPYRKPLSSVVSQCNPISMERAHKFGPVQTASVREVGPTMRTISVERLESPHAPNEHQASATHVHGCKVTTDIAVESDLIPTLHRPAEAGFYHVPSL
jgi:hypothetical protein